MPDTAPSVTAAPAHDATYDPHYFAPLFAVEDRHFWFRSRNDVIAVIVRRLTGSLPARYRVLEVGCGTGKVLQVLESVTTHGMVVGTDLFIEGLRFARRRTHVPLVQGDMHSPPFAETFDVIGLFDVLEHLPDDRQVLRDLHRMLAQGGALLLTVPARASLWSYFDEASHHYRRYEADDLREKLHEAGYRVEYLTSFMSVLFPMIWLGRRAARLLNRRNKAANVDDMAMGEWRIVPGVNALLYRLLGLERWWLGRQRTMPVGTSPLVVARKATTDD